MRRIGVLGGMGPEATLLLMSRVLARTAADDDSDHIPMIVDNNTQVPSRIAALIEKTGRDPLPVLVDMARSLQHYGADALAMPCNTAHHYAGEIAKSVSIPFLDMVELTAGLVAGRLGRAGTVGMLCSPAVHIVGVFDNAFARHGIETIYPHDEARMLEAIRAIKRSAADGNARKIVHDAAVELAQRGAAVNIVACSEFSLITDSLPAGRDYIDTIDVLADAVVAFATRQD